jgi:serine/threonine protein kinase
MHSPPPAEYLGGGDMVHVLSSCPTYNEATVTSIMKQLLKAVEHLHSHVSHWPLRCMPLWSILCSR